MSSFQRELNEPEVILADGSTSEMEFVKAEIRLLKCDQKYLEIAENKAELV